MQVHDASLLPSHCTVCHLTTMLLIFLKKNLKLNYAKFSKYEKNDNNSVYKPFGKFLRVVIVLVEFRRPSWTCILLMRRIWVDFCRKELYYSSLLIAVHWSLGKTRTIDTYVVFKYTDPIFKWFRSYDLRTTVAFGDQGFVSKCTVGPF